MTNVVSSDPEVASSSWSPIKNRQNATWRSGNYAVIGATLQIVGELLNEAVDVRATDRVLDVAAGSGNATLAAARRFATVVSTDYVPPLLERGRLRAEAEGFDNVTFEFADAEALPYPDASFDVILSTFGVMFAPDHEKSSRELLRVVRPGGRIGLASWTPEGFIGQMFRVVSKHVPPPAGVKSPALWGTRDYLQTLFAGASALDHTVRDFAFRYESPEHFVEVFRMFYGPVLKAFAALDTNGQAALETDLLTLLRSSARTSAAVPAIRCSPLWAPPIKCRCWPAIGRRPSNCSISRRGAMPKRCALPMRSDRSIPASSSNAALFFALPSRSEAEKFASRYWSVAGFQTEVSIPLRIPTRSGARRRRMASSPAPISGVWISRA